jgi:hypothetical protein
MEPPPARRIAGTAYFTDRNRPSRFTAVCHRLAAGIVHVGHHNLGALSRQCRRARCADARCTARYDSNLAIHLAHRVSPILPVNLLRIIKPARVHRSG